MKTLCLFISPLIHPLSICPSVHPSTQIVLFSLMKSSKYSLVLFLFFPSRLGYFRSFPFPYRLWGQLPNFYSKMSTLILIGSAFNLYTKLRRIAILIISSVQSMNKECLYAYFDLCFLSVVFCSF